MRLILLSLCLLGLATCGSDDDDIFTAQLALNRFDGWQLEMVNSNLDEVSTTAQAEVTDSTLAATMLTRAELATATDDYVNRTVGLEECERDDVLFFNDGVVAFGRTAVPCTDASERHILLPFDAKIYTTNQAVTRLTIVDPVRLDSSVYSVDELSDTRLVLSQVRSERPIIPLGPLNYSITYSFRAR